MSWACSRAPGLIALAASVPELEYLFRHALIQDAAYESLLKQERRSLHIEVAETLLELYPDHRDDMAPVLAHHFERAEDRARAIEYLALAARHRPLAVRPARGRRLRTAGALPCWPTTTPRRAGPAPAGRAAPTFRPSRWRLRAARQTVALLEAVIADGEIAGRPGPVGTGLP